MHVLIGPLIGLVINYFNLEVSRLVLLIQCSMPSAVLNYLVEYLLSKKIIDSVASKLLSRLCLL